MNESAWTTPVRVLEEAARTLGHSFSEIVPPEAQLHLLNAQRELLVAMAITIEHNASRANHHHRPAPAAKRGRRPNSRARNRRAATTAPAAPGNRPTKVAVD